MLFVGYHSIYGFLYITSFVFFTISCVDMCNKYHCQYFTSSLFATQMPFGLV